MKDLLVNIKKIGLIPVVVLDDSNKAVNVAKAIINGGINCAEITFRTSAAEQALRNISEAFPDMILGAGTILDIEQVDRAINAGAKFIVTPGYNPDVVDYCNKNNINVIPGCMDTNSIEMALAAGINTIKFFPAEQAGGLKMIKALSGPYNNLYFIPTGGVNKENISDYLSFNKVIACGGSWMVNKELIENEAYGDITRLVGEAINEMLDFKVVHTGINTESEDEAKKYANILNEFFGFKDEHKTSSIFSSPQIEICKKIFPGIKGHIAIGTNSCERAMYYLERKGITFDMESAKYKNGTIKSIYINYDFAGFAFHLLENEVNK